MDHERSGVAALLRLIGVFTSLTLLLTIVILWSVFRPSAANVAAVATATPTVAVSKRGPAVLATPKWIWATADPADDAACTLRYEGELDAPVRRATLIASCDNAAEVSINGEVVATCSEWTRPVEVDVTDALRGDTITIDVDARNTGGPAGFIALIELEFEVGQGRIVTDAAWRADDGPAAELGAHGADPWGELRGFPVLGVERSIEVADGFIVEPVYTVPRAEGSWVAITVDPQGRLITSAQGPGLYRFAPGATPERIHPELGGAQGLLAIDNDLYCVVAANVFEGPGLYRLRDTDGDDQYDETIRLRGLDTGGEHGPHAVIPGPDGDLYIVAGNHTTLPDLAGSTVPTHWGEDQLLPRLWDPNGHAVGIEAPGGWICRTDRDGAAWELVAVGFRNTYDIAFNAAGDLFTYDADMEWDMGASWYRPTRLNHVVSGVDFGWRSGSGKWPAHSPESLPAILDIGPGSPTGVCFGTETHFPDPYRRALFACDWTFGTIYAVDLEPVGATYRATARPFVTGRPLPIADVAANPVDGGLYFVIGGRGTPSAVYRVRAETPDPKPVAPVTLNAAAQLRRTLESLQGEVGDAVIDAAWPALGHDDIFVAHAARIALEFQPASAIAARLDGEPDGRTRLAALLALARRPDTDASACAAALAGFVWDDLDERDRRAWLRAWTLLLIRHEVDDAERGSLAPRLRAAYPTGDPTLDGPLCDLLVHLDEPVVVARTLPLLERSTIESGPGDAALIARNDRYGEPIRAMAGQRGDGGQLRLAHAISRMESGWTPELRARYFDWFNAAQRRRGGLSYTGFVDQVRANALAAVPEPERDRYAAPAPPDPSLPVPEGPGRAWTVEGVLELAGRGLAGRDLENGQRMFEATMCARCHRVGEWGAAGGPDLTALGTRFTVRDVVEAIVEPSRVISDQYEMTEFLLDDDRIVVGRVITRDDDLIRVMPTLLAPDFLVDIEPARIISERRSDVSPMQARLLDPLNPDEVRDLLAFLLERE